MRSAIIRLLRWLLLRIGGPDAAMDTSLATGLATFHYLSQHPEGATSEEIADATGLERDEIDAALWLLRHFGYAALLGRKRPGKSGRPLPIYIAGHHVPETN